MKQAQIITFPRDRRKKRGKKKRDPLNAGKKGRVYSRSGKLWVDFRYLGERVREPAGLKDTPANRLKARRQLDLVIAEIDNGVFKFAERFPHSKKKDRFSRLEGKTLRKGPEEVLFGEYAKKWMEEMRAGMSENQVKDYQCSLKNHLLPYFGDVPFSDFRLILMKKFLGYLKSRINRYGRPYSAKTIRNYLIPLRVIFRDAVDEFAWDELRDPFSGLKLPPLRRIRIQPFSYHEWLRHMEHMLPWYRPYFELAVQTGLRPSEQVALKWSAIDDRFIHIELSRVRKVEKADLKTEQSIRRIELRPHILKTLERQWELTGELRQPYVFSMRAGAPFSRRTWAGSGDGHYRRAA
jgi:integrase